MKIIICDITTFFGINSTFTLICLRQRMSTDSKDVNILFSHNRALDFSLYTYQEYQIKTHAAGRSSVRFHILVCIWYIPFQGVFLSKEKVLFRLYNLNGWDLKNAVPYYMSATDEQNFLVYRYFTLGVLLKTNN